MLKKLGIIVGIIVMVLWGGLYLLTNQIIAMVKNFEPYTFERVLDDPAMAEDYGIGQAKDPSDYGYEFEEVTFKSYLDDLTLSAWYVESANSSGKTIILIHGRTSNRLKTMKYLSIFKQTGLDSLYNFLILDCRNSGKSEDSETYMGYKFAEDIRGGIEYLKSKHQQDTFIPYGFSMGAMAIGALLDREDLALDQGTITRVILDSPLANAKENLRLRSAEMGLPDMVFENVYENFSEEINGYGERLRFSVSLKDTMIPILILQSNDDESTPAKFTKNELDLIGEQKNIKTWFMDGPDHVDIYVAEKYRDQYVERIADFLN